MGDRCPECENQGIINYDNNIGDDITDDGVDLWNAYKWLKEYSIFPYSGGWTDQTSKFIRCVKWVDLCNLKFEKYLKHDKSMKAGFAAKFNKMMRGKNAKK